MAILLPGGLFTGAMTIAAIMIVSVSERTVEIGIRRASGATVRTIWRQFLLESVAVAAVGGAIGTVVGLVGIVLGKTYSPVPLAVSSLPFLLGILGPMCAGLIGGLYPAVVASRINVIDALHYE